jgi:cell division septal protein FtsQ
MSATVDHRIAERRRRVREAGARRRLRVTLALGALALLGGLAAWLAQSPYFDVDEVTLTGMERSAAAAVLEEAGVVAGRPLVTVRAGSVEQALRADPWIAEAEVSVVWPNRVEVAITEHEPAAWIRTGSQWLLVAAGGHVLAEAGEPGPGQPIIDLATARLGAGDRFVDPAVVGAVAFVEALPPPLSDGVVVSGDATALWAEVDGITVRLGGPGDMTAKGRTLGALMATGLDPGSTVDLLSASRPSVRTPATDDPAAGGSTDASGGEAEGQVEGESQEP